MHPSVLCCAVACNLVGLRFNAVPVIEANKPDMIELMHEDRKEAASTSELEYSFTL